MARRDEDLAGDRSQRLRSRSDGERVAREDATGAAALMPRHRRLLAWRTRMVATASLSHDEQLRLLAELGFRERDLALVAPSGGAFEEPLEELWAIVGFLVADGTYDEDGIVGWVCGASRELGGRRPIDLLAQGGALSRVREAAETHLQTAGLLPSDRVGVVPLERREPWWRRIGRLGRGG